MTLPFKLPRIVLALLLTVIIGWLAWFLWRGWEYGASTQSTDNAYVHGDITAVTARISGYAVELLADDDDLVKAGQPLVRLDKRDYTAGVDSAKAALRLAEAQLNQARARQVLQQSKIKSADSDLQAAEANAKNAKVNFGRAEGLVKTGAVSRTRFDDAQAVATVMKAKAAQSASGLTYEQKQLDVIAADIDAAAAQVENAKAALYKAQTALGDTEIWAPLDGVIAGRKVRLGEYVAAGTRMMSVVPSDKLWIEANFRETQLRAMQPFDPVSIRIDMHPGVTVCGYVESIGPASGSEFSLIAPDNATGNFTKIVRRFPVRIRAVKNDPNASLLKPGMSTEVEIAITQAKGDVKRLGVGCTVDPQSNTYLKTQRVLPTEHITGFGNAVRP